MLPGGALYQGFYNFQEEGNIGMKITVKLFAYFRDDRFKVEQREIGESTTVGDIVDSLGIDRQEVGVLMINSRHTDFAARPGENDVLAIFPVIGGG
jgi:molybdopterin converting factor small subunit